MQKGKMERYNSPHKRPLCDELITLFDNGYCQQHSPFFYWSLKAEFMHHEVHAGAVYTCTSVTVIVGGVVFTVKVDEIAVDRKDICWASDIIY